MNHEPICIRHAGTIEEARIIVAWLDDQGVAAHVVDPGNPGVFAFGVTDDEGIAICVGDEAAAKKARTLLAERNKQSAAGGLGGSPIDVHCEECHEVNRISDAMAGTVQACTHCGAYLDVPGGTALA